ncbi:MAG TPA: TetR/AcrR family transcriptional regulator [Candidatus Binatia bacterium]|nr:TetR/AcrR family transcriptional regulator [Candidatus Binatia bacterium]
MASSKKKPGRGAEDRHERLLHRIEEIFLRDGFRRVTVAELAATLHCSRRAVYQIAESKEDLFVLVLDRVLGRIEHAGGAAATAAAGAGNKITAFIQPGLTELRNATPTFFADIAAHPPAQKLLKRHQDTRERELCKLIERGVRSGECRRVHAEVAAQALLAAYRAITSPAFLSNVDISLMDAVGEGRDLFLYGLLHPEE